MGYIQHVHISQEHVAELESAEVNATECTDHLSVPR